MIDDVHSKEKTDSEENVSWVHDVDDTWPPETSSEAETTTIPAPAPLGCEGGEEVQPVVTS